MSMSEKMLNMIEFDSLSRPNKFERHDSKKKTYGDDYDEGLNRRCKIETKSSFGSGTKEKLNKDDNELLDEIHASEDKLKRYESKETSDEDFELHQDTDDETEILSSKSNTSKSNKIQCPSLNPSLIDSDDDYSSSDEQIKMIEKRDSIIASQGKKLRDLEKQVDKLKDELSRKETERCRALKENETLSRRMRMLEVEKKNDDTKVLTSVETDLRKIGDILRNSLDVIAKKNRDPLRHSDSVEFKNEFSPDKQPQKRSQEILDENYDDTRSQKKIKRSIKHGDICNPSRMNFNGLLPTSITIKDEDTVGISKKNVQLLTKGLLNKYFTPEELADHSITGIPSNAFRTARPALDPERFKAIRNYIYNIFRQKKGWAATMTYAGRNLIGGYRKSLGKQDDDEDKNKENENVSD